MMRELLQSTVSKVLDEMPAAYPAGRLKTVISNSVRIMG